MDTCVNNDVDMDLLVDNDPDPREDYVEEHNKEVVEQNPDPDKVVEADLEMDPAAATEELEYKKALMKLGINPYTRSLEAIEVVDKKFDQTAYKTWTDYHNSPADKYARERMKTVWTDTCRPVTMKDYQANKIAFDTFIFGKKMFDFKNKFLQQHIDSKCKAVLSDKYYGTVSYDIQFKKKGEVTSTACVYALCWYKGKPSAVPIIPLLTCYDGCGEEYTSSESYRNAYSVEKAFGYFKSKDFKNKETREKVARVRSIGDFFNIPTVKEKVERFKKDVKDRDYEFATIDEVKTLKSTFFNKWLRGVTGNAVGTQFVKYVKKNDIVWAYWFDSYEHISVLGMVKTKNNKLTTIGFALNVPVRLGADIRDADKESEEHFDFDTALFV